MSRPSAAGPSISASTPVSSPGGPALTGGHHGYVQAVAAQRQGATGGELVTITILGIKEKRLDLEDVLSWFQQRPGFVALQVNERIDAIFARFATSVFAEQAIHDANAFNYGAEWARRNLDDDLAIKTGAAASSAPVASAGYGLNTGAPAASGGYSSRGAAQAAFAPAYVPPPARAAHHGGEELTTIIVLAIREKGWSLEELQQWFTSQVGFVAMQVNERIDGIFVKYSTASQAQQVMAEGNQKFGFGAEWARRNLDDDKSSHGASAYQGYAGAAAGVAPQLNPQPGYYGPAKRQRAQTGELDTICILSMKEKGLQPSDVQQWFQELQGFVAMQVNERIDGIFIKFNSSAAADKALQESNGRSLGAEWARRNLDL